MADANSMVNDAIIQGTQIELLHPLDLLNIFPMESLTTSGISPIFLVSLAYHVSLSLVPGGCFYQQDMILFVVNLLLELVGPPSKAGVMQIPLITHISFSQITGKNVLKLKLIKQHQMNKSTSST